MIKDAMSHNETVKPNDRQMKVLRENFPGCFKSDGSFDLERFKEFLSTEVDVIREGYELKFLGKNYARLLASLDTTTVVVPDEEHNSKPENKDSQNVYISGDNLDALKHLLKSYAGKIKCIYIDPPYNTGSDGFVYNDCFNFTAEQLATKLSIEESQAQRILEFTSKGSASHSAWLMFMYPRLLLARDLLADDGVIFISIDENEHSNLKLICDDVFGEDNFAGEIIWKNSSKNDQAYISIQHEYFICYVKDKICNPGQWLEAKEGTEEIFKAFEGFYAQYGNNWKAIHQAALEWYKQFSESNPIYNSKHYNWMDERGVYFASDISGPNAGQYVYDITHPVTGKICKAPASGWRYPKEAMLDRIANNLIHFADDETVIPNNKTYLADTLTQGLTSIKYKDGRVASKQLTALMGINCFTNPKDVDLLYSLFHAISINDGDIILDFFAGSGSTAEAVMKLLKDGINPHYIMVQLPENLDKALKRTTGSGRQVLQNAIKLCDSLGVTHAVDQIGKERIIRAAKKIKEEQPNTTIDLGFKHYTLQEPNETTIDKLERFNPKTEMFVDNNILEDFGCDTVIATWLVDDGYGLTSLAKEIDFAGYKAYYIDKHLYLIHEIKSIYDRDSKIDEKEVITAIVDKIDLDASFNPENVILFGYNFTYTIIEELKNNLSRLQHSEKNIHINFVVRY